MNQKQRNQNMELQETDGQSIGKRLKAFREQEGMTQEMLADKLLVTRQAVSNWERDKTLPDVYMIQKMAGLFGVGVDGFLEGIKEAEIKMPKTPGYLLAASGGMVFLYLAAGAAGLLPGKEAVGLVVVGVVLCVFIQLFLHLYFSSAVKTGEFSMLAGYSSQAEYRVDEVKKVLIQMDLHIGCLTFGSLFLLGACAFLEGSGKQIASTCVITAYCVDLCVALLLYNYRSIDKTLAREQDRKAAKGGFLSVCCFVGWIFAAMGIVAVAFAAKHIQNNSMEAAGYLGWIFLFLIVSMAGLFYEQRRVKKELERIGGYRPGVVFWIWNALLAAVAGIMIAL